MDYSAFRLLLEAFGNPGTLTVSISLVKGQTQQQLQCFPRRLHISLHRPFSGRSFARLEAFHHAVTPQAEKQPAGDAELCPACCSRPTTCSASAHILPDGFRDKGPFTTRWLMTGNKCLKCPWTSTSSCCLTEPKQRRKKSWFIQGRCTVNIITLSRTSATTKVNSYSSPRSVWPSTKTLFRKCQKYPFIFFISFPESAGEKYIPVEGLTAKALL